MYSTYLCSTSISSIGSKWGLPSSVSENSYMYNERCHRTPLTSSSSTCYCCSSCCSCCAHSKCRVSINPSSYLYGLRQSVLIQLSASRTLTLGGGDRYSGYIPVYGVRGGDCEISRSLKERSWRRIRRLRCMLLDKEDERFRLGGNAEAVISLLSEVGDDYLGGRETTGRSFKRMEKESRKTYDRESYGKRKKNDGSCKHKIDSVGVGSREEDYRQNERTDAVFSGKDFRENKTGSRCSSYYSFSSSGDFDDDWKVEAKHEEFVEESLRGYKKNSTGYGSKLDREVLEEFSGHVDDEEGNEEASEWRSSAETSRSDRDWRKEANNRLTKLSIGKTQSRKALSSLKYLNEEDKLEVNFNKATNKKYGRTGNMAQPELRRKFKEHTDISEFSDSVETMSQSRKFNDEKRNQSIDPNMVQKTRDEQHKQISQIGGEKAMGRGGQHHSQMSNTHHFNTEGTSTLRRRFENRMKSWEEDSALVRSSIQETEKQHHQTGDQIIGQIEMKRTPKQFSETSEVHASNIEKTSILQSGSTLKNQESTSNLFLSSHPKEKRQPVQTEQEVLQETQSSGGSRDAISISVVQASDVESITNSQKYYGTVINQGSNLNSLFDKQTGKTRERSRTNDGIAQSTRISQEIMMPPLVQMVDRGSLQIEPITAITTQEISSGTLESGSNAFITRSGGRTTVDDEPLGGARKEDSLNLLTHEDALGSADRSSKFSMQYLGEFVDKIRQEVSTSETREEEKISETPIVYSGQKQAQRSTSKHGSEQFQLEEHDSRSSSKGSGIKGPSDEMWHVTDHSVQNLVRTETPEGSTTAEDAVAVRRNGRPLWRTIGDIVRLRWGSQSEAPATQSGAKSSSNESASSETWYSGREHEENSDENGKKQKRRLQESTYSGEGEVSTTMKSEDNTRSLEADRSSSPGIIESASASKGILLASRGENLGLSEGGESSQIIPSGVEILESSLPLAPRGIRRSPVIEKNSGTNKSDAFESDSTEQPVSARLGEVPITGGKDSELKQRKFQRSMQVQKDSFDEWEEAYKLESEQRKIDEIFMREALLEAKKAADAWEVPVGAVLVQNGKIIARGYNLVEELRDSTAHAEMICIREASNLMKTWRLSDTTLYVTLEPCPMCAGAILQSRIDTLVWGAPNKLLGADGSWIRLFRNGGGKDSEPKDMPAAPVHPFHPNMKIRRGVLASDCADAMQQFFQLRRKKKKSDPPTPPTPPSCLSVTSNPSTFISRIHHIFHSAFCL